MGEVKVVYVSHCSEVYVSDTTDHKHEVDKDYINTSVGYKCKWSHEATDIIITGINPNQHRGGAAIMAPLPYVRELRQSFLYRHFPGF